MATVEIEYGAPEIRSLLLDGLVDYAPKDSTDLMQRPFFSLSKRKRVKPIEYKSPDGQLFVTVTANQAYGMATIWDADVLIWCISRLVKQREAGNNDLSPVIYTTPHELLTGIARGTGGANYRELMAAIMRLRTTQVETNIVRGKKRYSAFHYLGDIDGQSDDKNLDELKALRLRVPDFLLDGISMGHVLTLDRQYFELTGGLERVLYRIARKHAGAQRDGWTCRMSLLHEKTGSEAGLPGFSFKVRQLCMRDPLPRYGMQLTQTKDGQSAVRFVDRAFLTDHEAEAMTAAKMRFYRDDARTAWVDAKRPSKDFEAAWERWCDQGFPPGDFAAEAAKPQARLL